jgi:hypothetical protein
MAKKTQKAASRMDPQQRHNQAFLPPTPDTVADAAALEASLKEKNGPSMEPPLPRKSSPVEQANNVYANAHDAVIMVRLMRNNPGRAFEDVEKMARAAGLSSHDPIASAMSRHPGLTREEAEEMAESFGF